MKTKNIKLYQNMFNAKQVDIFSQKEVFFNKNTDAQKKTVFKKTALRKFSSIPFFSE